jgi:hypothetical protein
MPVLWGHSKEEQTMKSEGIDQYTKWFDLMEMDFSLHHSTGGWTCVAMFRYTDTEEYSSPVLPSVSDALHFMYARIMKDVRSPY